MPIDDLIAANRAFLRNFRGPIPDTPARKRLAVVTCMDNRLVGTLPPALGLGTGDAIFVRVAGARIGPGDRSAIRSVAVAILFAGVREVVVVGHTDCRTAAPAERAEEAMRALGMDPDAIRSGKPIAEALGLIESPEHLPAHSTLGGDRGGGLRSPDGRDSRDYAVPGHGLGARVGAGRTRDRGRPGWTGQAGAVRVRHRRGALGRVHPGSGPIVQRLAGPGRPDRRAGRPLLSDAPRDRRHPLIPAFQPRGRPGARRVRSGGHLPWRDLFDHLGHGRGEHRKRGDRAAAGDGAAASRRQTSSPAGGPHRQVDPAGADEGEAGDARGPDPGHGGVRGEESSGVARIGPQTARAAAGGRGNPDGGVAR
ncbi:MAG: hypothetical protein HYY93_02480 [Planctomycetes bacterium]|nr:hypothetical protein [Planctomycetota bacterium]